MIYAGGWLLPVCAVCNSQYAVSLWYQSKASVLFAPSYLLAGMLCSKC